MCFPVGYKHNFHIQLVEVRRILCQLMYSSSPRKYHHPQCPINATGVGYYSEISDTIQNDETKSDNLTEVAVPNPNGAGSSRIPFRSTHGGSNWQDNLQKDNELLESMYNLMHHWVLHYENNLECVLLKSAKSKLLLKTSRSFVLVLVSQNALCVVFQTFG